MWGTAHLQNWAVELHGTCPVSKGDKDVQAPAGLGPLYLPMPTNGIFLRFLLSSRYFRVMLSEVGYWEAFNVCLLSTR